MERLYQHDPFLKKLLRWVKSETVSSVYKHILSHQTIMAKFIILDLSNYSSVTPLSMVFYSPKKDDRTT